MCTKKYCGMKSIKKIILSLILVPTLLAGCSDLLDVDSKRTASPDDYTLNASNDTLFSMFSVFAQLQKLSQNYVFLGEIRGDLMDVTDKSDMYLKQISNFEISSDNPYANVKDYYSVINNCNYIIQKLDTSRVVGAKKVMLREYAACKAIRAWTYMQLAINYGSAIYYDKAILTVADAESIQSQPAKTLDELAPILINDLIPYKDVDIPSLGFVFDYYSDLSFFPVRFLLGDLYLWTGQYENAAQEYYDLINKKSITIRSDAFSATWDVTNNAFTGYFTIYNGGFPSNFEPLAYTQITNIASSNQYGHNFQLDSLTANRSLIPSAISLNNWDSQHYVDINNSTIDPKLAHTLYKMGDFRKYGSVSYSNKTATIDTASLDRDYYIYKYLLMNPYKNTYKTNKMIIVYRSSLLYLRYAEALNRLNKPNAAFAVMKNGLNHSNLLNTNIIPHKEMNIASITPKVVKSSTNADSTVYDTVFVAPKYMDFGDSKFDKNVGIRMLSLGTTSNLDKKYFIVPKLPTMQDSILYVEDKIQQELALENAFEGNRFQDLMRMAIHRNDNAYLADIVAKKHTNNKEAIRAKLMNRANWYVPKK